MDKDTALQFLHQMVVSYIYEGENDEEREELLAVEAYIINNLR